MPGISKPFPSLSDWPARSLANMTLRISRHQDPIVFYLSIEPRSSNFKIIISVYLHRIVKAEEDGVFACVACGGSAERGWVLPKGLLLRRHQPRGRVQQHNFRKILIPPLSPIPLLTPRHEFEMRTKWGNKIPLLVQMLSFSSVKFVGSVISRVFLVMTDRPTN